MPGRKVVVALDDSDCSLSAAQWACINLVRPDDAVHLISVIGPVSMGMGPALPMSGAGSLAAAAVRRPSLPSRFTSPQPWRAVKGRIYDLSMTKLAALLPSRR